MKGTRTALDLESEEMEEIALNVEEEERYGTAEEFCRPDDSSSEVSSIADTYDRAENVLEAGLIQSDDEVEEEEEEEKHEEEEGNHDKEIDPEESTCDDRPLHMFIMPDLEEDPSAISTLGSPSIIQNYPPPEGTLIVAPRRSSSAALVVAQDEQDPVPEKRQSQDQQHRSQKKDEQIVVQVKEEPRITVDFDEESATVSASNTSSLPEGLRGRVCTHACGKLESMAVILSLIAFILTGTATDRCDFLHLENEEVPTFWDLQERTVGLVQFETIAADAKTTQCLYWFDYPDASGLLYDDTWHAARIMSATATLLGLFFVGFTSTFSCIPYKRQVFQRLSFASLSIPLLYGLSFVAFGSKVCLQGSCEIGIGGLLMVLGVIVWLLTSAVLFMIPGADGSVLNGKKGMAEETRKRSPYLGLAMLTVMAIIVAVNLGVIFGRDMPETIDAPPMPLDSTPKHTDWIQAGETTRGPYPDAHEYLSMSGDAKVMSLIGRESVLTLEFDAARKLWYPFGNMISANLDPVGWGHGDRVTRFQVSAASLSEDGHVIAVGSANWAEPNQGGEEYEFGKVQAWRFHLDSQRWIPKGHPITGKSIGDAFASKMKLSKDGRRLAVLASGRFGKTPPYVRVYQYDDAHEKNGNWVQIGGDIVLESFWTASGFAFSGDGSSVALGSLRIGRLGLVTVWKYDEDTKTWNRSGSPISSGSSSREDQFGESLAISGNGAHLVVGDPGGLPSYARVFWLNGSSWEQLGQDLECTLDDGRCAHDVAMSKFGTTIAMTEYSYHQLASVYSLDILKEEWVQVGDEIEISKLGERAEDTTIELSSDGRSVAFGVTFQDTQTQVWRYTGDLSINSPLKPTEETLQPSEALATLAPVEHEDLLSSETSDMWEFSPTTFPSFSSEAQSHPENETISAQFNGNSTLPISPLNETDAMDTKPQVPPHQNSSDAGIEDAELFEEDVEDFINGTEQQPWAASVIHDDVVYFLRASFSLEQSKTVRQGNGIGTTVVERYDLSEQAFLPPLTLSSKHGPASALGIDNEDQMYVGYGSDVFRYSLNGTDEVKIAAHAKTTVIGFHFDGDLVFINAGQYFLTVNGKTNKNIKQYFAFNEMQFGTSMSTRHKKIFGRIPDEVAVVSGDIVRRSDMWFKEYNEEGTFVNEELARLDKEASSLESASKTWMFPDQTRLVDNKGYVFSVATAEHVYTLDVPDILDIAWLGGEVMIVLQGNGRLVSISQELRVTGILDLETFPTKVAVANGEVFTFSQDLGSENGIQVDIAYLGHLNPALPGRPINPTNVPFTPEFTFVDNQSLLYMLSKGHSSIFVLEPESKEYLESIKLNDVPRFVAYSAVNHEVYTLHENSVLSKINLAEENKTEVPIATLPAAPLGLSTAGEFIFVCDDAGSFATHYTFFKNGTIASAADWNHYDEEFVWNDANRKMYFFRQADPTDLMTEHIFENGTIGNRVDSFLNNNSGFEHPIRVDPSGHHALLGSGVIHNAKSLKRMNRALSNSVLDAAFGEGFVHTIRNLGDDMVQVQQWHSHSFELDKADEFGGRAIGVFALSKKKTVALATNGSIPVAYVLDEKLKIL